MSINEYLIHLKEKNIVVSVQGDDLKIKAPQEALTKEILEGLKVRKSEIIDLFRNSTQHHIPQVAPQQYYPLSHSQKRLWLLDQFVEVKGVYNVSMFFSYSSLNKESLENAFVGLLSRHEILRTTFHVVNGEPKQCVRAIEDFNTKFDSQKVAVTDSFEAVFNEELFSPLDLSSAAIRGKLFEMTDGTHAFVIILHHIITDEWSTNILNRDFEALYKHFNTGKSLALAPLKIQYKDYAHWQHERLRLGYFDRSLQYWRNKLTGELPTLNLPFDYKHTNFKTYAGAGVSFELSADLVNKISQLGNAHQATLYIVLVSIVKSLLYRYTNLQEDIIVGTAVTGREHIDLDDQVGFYVNTIVLRSSLNETDSFSKFITKVRDTVFEAYEHQHLPFDLLIEDLNLHKDMSRNPVFDVMINYGEVSYAAESETSSKDEIRIDDQGVSKFDLTYSFNKLGNGCLDIEINYNTGLFKKEKIVPMAKHLKNLILAIIKDPHCEIYKLPLLSEEEVNQLTHTFNNTHQNYNLDTSIKELFERQVKTNPKQPCIISNSGELTFEEVNAKANQLAHYLIDAYQVRQGDYVGVMMESSIERMIALISVVKMGAAYVPIDPDYPLERAQYIVSDTQIPILLTASDTGAQSVILKLTGCTIVPVALSQSGSYSTANVEISTSVHDIFTILYTSGSTGKPKGVLIQQKGIINRLQWLWSTYEFGPTDVIYQKTPYVFDVSMIELFMPLMFGAKLLVASSNSSKDIVSNIVKHNVSYIHFSPTLLNQFLNTLEGENQIVSLRFIFASGEALLKETVNRYYSRLTIPLINVYGPTEASIDVSVYETKPGDEIIPIGKPIANVQLYILDKKNGLLPVGIPGEVGIGGICLAKGYLNAPEKTAERFIPNNFVTESGQRIYKTGDVGCWNSTGQIEYLGRIDNQTNINGLRIELGEIESTLLNHPRVKEAVVMVDTDRFNNYHLIAYYTKKSNPLIQVIKDRPGSIVSSPTFNSGEVGQLETLATPKNDLDNIGIDEWFAKSAVDNAKRIAIVCGKTELTYEALEEKSSQLAFSLITDHQIKPGDRVGILMERSEKTIITLLAILKTGAAYVPLDMGYPDKRIQYILRDASVKVIMLEKEDGSRNFGEQTTAIIYDEIEGRLRKKPLSFVLGGKRSVFDLCYICYTSGSTGAPKGVMIEHHSVVDYVKTFTNYFAIANDDIVLQQASIAFDTAVEEIFPVLCAGGKLIIHSGGGQDIDNLIHISNEHKVTLISTTPLVINELNSRVEEMQSWPRLLISGGDELRPGYVDKIIDKVDLYNTYGPTETTVCVSFAPIKDIKKCHVIGSSIANHSIYLLNEELEKVANGEAGEICVAGPGLARGYVNLEDETKRKFVPNPFGNGLIYRTGDMGRSNDEGELEFLGRKDRQVKIRGYRVELSEVDSAMADYKPGLISFTVVKNDADDNKRLITFFKSEEFIEPKEARQFLMDRLPHFMVPDYLERVVEFPRTVNGKIDIDALSMPTSLTMDHALSLELKNFLREKLPAYMIPSQFRNLEKMPLTVTGKINRKALESLELTYKDETEHITPGTQTEKRLAKIWESILKKPNIGLMHSFFEVGGNSLKAVQILSAIYKEFKKEISLKDIFNNPTIDDLANVIDHHDTDERLLIRLSTTKKGQQNIFFIPPVLGSSTIFSPLANQMSKHFNVYGLQNRGFDAEDEFSSSIHEMARDFVSEIKNIEKGSHFSIVGYSMGVPIAFEMAKILEAEGLSVQLIFIDRGATEANEDGSQSISKEMLGKALEFELKHWLKFLEGKNIERIKNLVYNNIQLLNAYAIHGKIKANVLAIEAENSRMEGWREYTSGNFSVQAINATHYGILNVENNALLAQWICNSFHSMSYAEANS
jgi:amino acid adenylation domain-containing protein